MGYKTVVKDEYVEIDLKVKVKVHSVLHWDGISDDIVSRDRAELISGELGKLIKSVLCKNMCCDDYTVMLHEHNGVVFDQVNLEVIEVK